MAPRQSKGAEATPAKATPTKANKKEQNMDAKYSPKKHNAQRVKKHKQAKRAQQAQALQAAIRTADSPAARKELASLEGRVYQPWKFRRGKSAAGVAQLERIVKEQEEEIRGLKRTLQGQVVPSLEPATPVNLAADEGPDSSPVKIQEQLMNDIGQASGEPEGGLEVQEVVEETTEDAKPEHVDGVEASVTTEVEKTVEGPTLESVEAEEVQETVEKDAEPAKAVEQPHGAASAAAEARIGTPSIPKKLELRDSSADSSAGTPRNLRRSPRKRTVKRKSLT